MGIITDDDGEPDLFISDTTQLEGATLSLIVSLSAISGRDITFTRVTTAGTAISGTDYTALALATLTLAKGTLSLPIAVVSLEDLLYENDETFTVDVAAVVNANPVDVQGLGTITNDEALPLIFISDAAVTEGGTLAFVVSLNTASGLDVIFDATSFADTALQPSDYAAVNLGSLTILAGTLNVPITVVTVDDLLNEGSESFAVSLSNLALANIGDDSGTGAITDNDVPPALYVTDAVTVTEGQTSSFEVTLSAASGLDVTFSYRTFDDTAVATQDYDSVGPSVATIAAGNLSVVIPVATTDDDRDEVLTEYYTLSISAAANAALSDAVGDGGITDNDNPPQIFIVDSSSLEGNTAYFTISISAVSDLDVDFDYVSYDGSGVDQAVAPGDYAAVSLSAQISAGNLTLAVPVITAEDVIDEVDEKYAVSLVSVVNATSADDLAEGTITDDDGTPVLTIYDTTVTEGETAALLVSLSNPSSREIMFEWMTGDDSALAASDYSGVATTIVTIPALGMTATLSVVTTEDLIQEPTEQFFVDLTNPINATGTPQGVVTVNDDDLAPDIFITDAIVSEGETLGFVVSLSSLSGLEITFNYQSYDGSATIADLDYGNFVGTATIGAGTWSTTIYLETTEDTKHEGNETLTVSLSAIVNAGSGDLVATGTINNDDAVPGLYISDHAVSEGETFSFTISLDAVSGLETVVSWATADGSATTADTDYTAVMTTVVTIPVGALSVDTNVVTIEDTKFEANEILLVTLTAPVNASIQDGSGFGTINNDDTEPTLTVYDLAINEGETGQFIASLSAISGVDVVFDWQTYFGTAGGADLTAVPATTVTIAVGQMETDLSVITTDDLLNEGDEDFTVSLAALAGATVGDDLAVGTITDDDAPPGLFVTDATVVTEGETATFAITLGAVSALDVSFSYRTYDGTAVSVQDYTLVPLTVGTIPAGSLSFVVSVLTTDDSRDEVSAEDLTLSLSAPTNAGISDAVGIGTINDNDDPPTLHIVDATVSEGGTLSFLVSISSLSDLDVDFLTSTADGTASDKAQAPADYTALVNLAGQIAAGALTVSMEVPSAQDTLFELDEKFLVTLTGLVNATAGDVSADGTITNDDAAPSISVYDLAIIEGDSGNFAVSLSAVSELDVVFTWQTYYGSAGAADFTAVGATVVTIAAGQTQTLLEVVTTEDVINESSETFLVSLSGAVDGTFSDAEATGTITDDDGAPLIYVTDAADVTEGQTSVFLLTLSAISGQDISFNYQTYDDTAEFTQDYTAIASTVGTIPAGSLSFLVSVVTTDDSRDEVGTEYYSLSLSSLVNVNAGDDIGSAGINDNDNPPSIFIDDITVTEGGTLWFTVSISALSDLNVDFNYQTYDGVAADKAVAPGDYTAINSTAGQIAAGSLTFAMSVVSLDDGIDEADEKFDVSLSSVVNASAGDLVGLGTLNDDDGTPVLAIYDITVTEGETAGLVVSLSHPSSSEIVFDWFTANGTAVSATDYTPVATTTVTLVALAMTTTLNVVTTEDVVQEVTEDFVVSLANPVNATGTPTGTVTINDDDGAPEIFVSDASAVSEGGTSSFVITLSVASGLEINFSYRTYDGTALSAQDYTSTPLTVGTIPAGAITFVVNVITTDDAVDEVGSENYTLSLSSLVNVTAGDLVGSGAITDNDDPPLLFIGDATVTEGETATFAVSIAAVSDLDVIFSFASNDATATAGSDYLAVGATVATIPAGSLTMAVLVVTTDDTVAGEGVETLNVTLSGHVNAGGGDLNGVGTMNDNDSTNLFIADSTVTEGGTLAFTVSLSTTSAVDVTFDFQTVDGTATSADSDYTALPLTTMTIAAGSLTVSIEVATTQDTKLENDETLVVTLTSLANANAGDISGDGTITNDDVAPLIFIGDASVTEGQTAVFAVSLSEVSALDAVFTYQTVAGTATAGSDYTGVAAIVMTIPAGNLTLPLAVLTSDDVIAGETPETFNVTLTSLTNVGVGDVNGVGTITDNDTTALFIADASVSEGGTLVFTVSLSLESAVDVSFNFQTVDGSATTADSDYAARAVTALTIAAGGMTGTIEVVTTHDTKLEVDETLTVTLTGVVGAANGDLSGEGTITNNDVPPAVFIGDASVTEGQTAIFAVSISAISALDVSFDYATTDSSATGGADYTTVTATTATIPAGSLTLALSFVTQDDVIAGEGSETYNVTLAGLTNVSAGDVNGVGTINDNDTVDLFIADAALDEGGTLTFNVSLSTFSAVDVTFNFNTVDGTATTADSDYTARALTSMTIAAGALTNAIAVVTIHDTKYESNETITVTLTSLVNANAADINGIGTINNNDLVPGIFVSDASISEGDTATFAISLSEISGLAVSVQWFTADGTALISDSDYGAVAPTAVTIPAGSLTVAAVVASIEDTRFEGNETFTVSLINPVLATISVDTGLGTITNDDVQPDIFIGDSTATEGATSTFAVSLSAISGFDAIFSYATTAATATAGTDYTTLPTTVATIPAGSLTTSVTVTTLDDAEAGEGSEAYNVTLTGLTTVGAGRINGVGTINDNDVAELFVADTSVTEGGTLVFAVSLSTTSAIDVTFNFQTVDGTATTADSDYTARALTAMTITAGALTSSIAVVTTPDNRYEIAETLAVTLTSVANAISGDFGGVGTINNDDLAPELYISDASAVEGSTLGFVISLSGVSGLETTVSWTTYDGTALSASDYTQITTTLVTIAAGSLSVPAPVISTQDTLYENDETILASLSGATNATITVAEGTGTITNDDTMPTLAIYDLTVLEAATAQFAVSLSALSGLETVFVWETIYGSAGASDITAVSATTVTIAALSSSVQLPVVTTHDVLNEANETFDVTIHTPTNATVADGLGTGTITDDDGAPLLYVITAPTVTEGATSQFWVTLSSLSGQDVTFTYQTSDDSAEATQDYSAVLASTGTIPLGSLSVPLLVVTTDDVRDEVATEYFNLTISSPNNAVIGQAAAQGGILDNDVPPTLFITDATVTEGGTLQFWVTISAVTDLNVDFNYESQDGIGADKALAPGDYGAVGVTAGQIVAGGLSLAIPVVSVQDTLFELDERLTVTLTALVNAGSGDVSGEGTITNDDAQPNLFIGDASVTEGVTAIFAVSISAASGLDSIFTFQTVADTATAGSDYTGLGATVATIPAGSLTMALAVETIDDVIASEGAETYGITLTSLTNVGAGDVNGLGTINDNDSLSLFVADSSVTEGGTLAFAVSLSTTSALDVTFNFNTVDGTATAADGDYTARALTAMTIPAGALTSSISVVTSQDTRFETDENLSVTLTSVVNADVGDLNGAGTITNDDSQPDLFISDATVTEGDTAIFAVSISSISGLDSIFTFQTVADTATAGSDYTSLPATVATIPAGSLTMAVAVITIEDTIAGEGAETYNVTLTGLTNLGAGDISGLGTINDNDTATLFIADSSVAEGGTLVFAVSLSTTSATDVTFDFQSVDGTATTADSDYTARALTAMTITAGALTQSIAVVTTVDSRYENDETLAVTLTSVVGADNGDLNGDGTITNDDSMPEIFIGDATVTEGATGTFAISISAVSALDVVFSYSTVADTATAGADYTTVPVTVATIQAGNLTMAMTVVTVDDVIANESSETYNVTLTGLTNASAGDANGVGTINDNDTVDLFIVDSSVTEGGTLLFAVSLSTTSAVDVTFDFNTVDGTATTADSDYTARALTAMTITAGSLTQSISVVTTSDSKYENNDTLTLTLTSLSNVVVGDISAVGTITNDDTQPDLFISDATVTEAGTLIFAVSLSAVSGLDVTFDFQTLDGTATTANSDYTARPLTAMTLSAGAVTGSISVVTTHDLTLESDEVLTVTLASAVNAGNGRLGAEGTIEDNDILPFTWVGLGGDGLWTTTTNWSSNVVPGASDVAIFNTACTTNCGVNINGDITIAGVNMEGTFTGAITQASGRTITIGASGWVQSAGAFVGSDANISSSGGISVAGGSFASTSATLTSVGAFAFLAPTSFGHGNGSIALTDAGLMRVDSGTLNNLTLNTGCAAPGSRALFGAVTVDGSFTDSLCADLTLDGGVLVTKGNISISDGGGGSATVKVAGASSQNIVGVGGYLPNFEIASTGGTVSLTGTIGVKGSFVRSSGAVDAGTSKVILASDNVVNAPGMSFYDLDFVLDACSHFGDFAVNSALSVLHDLKVQTCSAIGINGGPIAVSGNVTVLDNKSGGSLGISMVGAGAQTISHTGGSFPGGPLLVNKASGNVIQATGVTLNGGGQDLTIQSGTWLMSGYGLTISNGSGTDNVLTLESGTELVTSCGSLTYEDLVNNGGTIDSGAASPNMAITDSSVNEGETLAFVVSLDDVRCAGDVTVNYQTVNGTATGGSDFTAASGVLTFSPGQTVKTISIIATEDAVAEGNEVMSVSLSAITNGTFVDNIAVGTIVNDDTDPYMWTGNAFPNTNWSNGANWFNGVNPPNSTQVAIFNNLCTHCEATVNTFTNVAGIRFDMGYSGAVTQAAGIAMNVGASFLKMDSGSFMGGDAAITVAVISISGGSFTSTSNTLAISQTWGGPSTPFYVANPTLFNANGGLVRFSSYDSGIGAKVLYISRPVKNLASGQFFRPARLPAPSAIEIFLNFRFILDLI